MKVALGLSKKVCQKQSLRTVIVENGFVILEKCEKSFFQTCRGNRIFNEQIEMIISYCLQLNLVLG